MTDKENKIVTAHVHRFYQMSFHQFKLVQLTLNLTLC